MVCASRVRHHSPQWHMERLVRGQMVLFILAPACGMLVILSTASSRKLGRNKQRAPEPRERRITPPNRAPVDKQSAVAQHGCSSGVLCHCFVDNGSVYIGFADRFGQVHPRGLRRGARVTPSRWSATFYIAWQQGSRAASAYPQSTTREQAARA